MMVKEKYQLYRYAQAQISNLTNARLPKKYDIENYCDLETPSGKKIDIKACRVGLAPNSMRRIARYALNLNKDGRSLGQRVDYVVCIAYDENLKPVNVLCIPGAELPTWDTSIGISLTPSRSQRANKWYKFITTLEELKTKLK